MHQNLTGQPKGRLKGRLTGRLMGRLKGRLKRNGLCERGDSESTYSFELHDIGLSDYPPTLP